MRPSSGIDRQVRRPYSLATAFLLCLSFASAQNWGFTFPNATDPRNANQTFVLGDVLNLEWASPFPAVNLAVVAQDAHDFVFLSHNNTQHSFAWDVDVNFTSFTLPFFYLYLENAYDTRDNVYSALFRVDSPAAGPNYPTVFFSSATKPLPIGGLPTNGPLASSVNPTTNVPVTTSNPESSGSNIASTLSSNQPAASTSIGSGVPSSSNTGVSSTSNTGIPSTSNNGASPTTDASISSSAAATSHGSTSSSGSGGTAQTSIPAAPASQPTDPTNSLSNSKSQSNQSKTLTPGTSAGIAIGAIFGAAVISVLGYLLRRRMAAKKAASPRPDTAGSGESVLLGGRPIGPPMQQQHVEGDAPWFGQAIGSPGHDGLGTIHEDGSGAYMYGALAESGAAGAVGTARTGRARAPSSMYGQDHDDPYGLDSYYEHDEGPWPHSGPTPPLPGRNGSGGYGRKFTHMYWDNLDGGRDRIDQAPQVRHDELPGRVPLTPHDPYRGELE